MMISALAASLSMAVFAASPEEVAASAMHGYELFIRDSLPDDRKTGYELMLAAAWEGDAKAANNIGWLMQNGEYVEKDLSAAFRWYERAADQGLPAAALNYMDMIISNPEGVMQGIRPDRERMARASLIAGTALSMGRGLPYDPRRGEELLLRAALFGDRTAALTIAQQLEMYPDSFSYLPLAKIARECDSLLPAEERNIPDEMPVDQFADTMLTPDFWYGRIPKDGAVLP